MNVDFKIKAWERVTVPDERKDEVIQALKNGKILTANDLITFLDDQDERAYEYEGVVPETEEQMVVSENNGHATIEVISHDEEVEWDNS